MQGLLNSVGVQACQVRAALSLSRIAPIQYASRQSFRSRLSNPFPYCARLFCESYMDQNEKCVMCGVTHVVAIDGYSWNIVELITKNPILIYALLFRPLLLTCGLWEQVRLDRGTKFSLVVIAQQHLSTPLTKSCLSACPT